MRPPEWITRVLEANAGKCLDTEEERMAVAQALTEAMHEPAPAGEPDLDAYDLAERVVEGREVSSQAHKEIAQKLLDNQQRDADTRRW